METNELNRRTFKCSSCDSIMSVQFLHTGEPAKCKACGAEMPVPEKGLSEEELQLHMWAEGQMGSPAQDVAFGADPSSVKINDRDSYRIQDELDKRVAWICVYSILLLLLVIYVANGHGSLLYAAYFAFMAWKIIEEIFTYRKLKKQLDG